ncbi:endonuclease/exonuclease/phosphatase family protein [Chroococcidiopsis sp. TS-821]|uniref:endonuclease/exonuclease/phosphatase family protein n=1 Tax=Chroococcidiopsis sp. TS-821 TaxID=1378066 RepID=UPI000CEDF1AA|nr:endonuclease/exonuclease/phosphatase family protein [Chroococcidiopsis sp. TS-821]PPS39837.1 hypothetical protein B1A85_21820 [Chroococcidiopsis sp. TS-821]
MAAVNSENGYSQNFDALINSGSATWANDATIPSWYTARTGTGTSIVASNGSSNAGNLYSFGLVGSSDRALGSIGSGNAAAGDFYWGVRLVNNTNQTITGLDISYVGEQWRFSGANAPQTVDFSYQIGAQNLTSGNWIDFDPLDFTSPVTSGTTGALNGNADANRTFKSATLTNLVLEAEQEIWLRWFDPDHPGADHGLAIDDFTVAISEQGGSDPVEPGNIRIFDIQGTSHRSPLAGQQVTNVPGIVTAVRNNGFYIQDATGDGNEATSDGIFIFTSSAPNVAVGDAVLASGIVGEFRPGGANSGNLTTTQISGASFNILSRGNALPEATIIGIEGRKPPTERIYGNAVGGNVENPGNEFNPQRNGLDFYESLEGMRVQVDGGVVVGPTNQFNEIWVLGDNGIAATGRTPRGGIVISPDDFNPERIQIQIDSTLTPGSAPQVNVGDRLDSVTGILDYSFGNFEVLSTVPVTATPGGLQREVTTLDPVGDRLTVASYNIENFHPGSPASQINGIAKHIAQNLKAPDIIALQEVQDNSGPTNDGIVDAAQSYQVLINAIASAGGPTYKFRDIAPIDGQDGGQPGGNIRVGYLYNPERANFIDRPGGTATSETTVINGRLSESPGRVEPNDPAFTASRKPLAGEFVFNGQRLFLINNHFSAKSGSDPLFGRFQPPTNNREDVRAEQARINREFVEDILAANSDARAIVLGDLNEFQFFPPLKVLEGGAEQVLNNLTETLPENERYSYIFQGNSQALDHILVTDSLLPKAEYDIVHVNAEFADQDSDHEPLLSRFALANPTSTVGNSRLVFGTAGDDEIAAQGRQTIFAGNGDDLVGPAPSSIGSNIINGGRGNDELFARSNDTLLGGIGNDYLNAADGTGNNQLYGGIGNDTLFAGGTHDQLYGQFGNDVLYAGNGGNFLSGGFGNDQFWIALNQLPETANTITDFNLGNNVLGISGVAEINSFDDLTITQSGANTVIRALNQDIAVLTGVQANTLNSNRFVFA